MVRIVATTCDSSFEVQDPSFVDLIRLVGSNLVLTLGVESAESVHNNRIGYQKGSGLPPFVFGTISELNRLVLIQSSIG